MKNRERRRIQQVIITLGMVLCLGGWTTVGRRNRIYSRFWRAAPRSSQNPLLSESRSHRLNPEEETEKRRLEREETVAFCR